MGRLGWIDSHCHLTCAQLLDEFDDLVCRAQENEVLHFLIICCSLAEAEAALVKKAQHPDLFDIAVGFHPSDIKELTQQQWDGLEKLAKNPNVSAIGEIGLDYYWDKDNHPQQKEVFIRQIQLANQVNKPIIIHSRDAILDTLTICKQVPVIKKGIVHCFSSSLEMAREFIKLGYHIGLGGPVTFKNAHTPKEVAAGIPLHALQLETDCPYLTPHPFRGKRNEPMYVPVTARLICELRNIDEQELEKSCYDNYQSLFH